MKRLKHILMIIIKDTCHEVSGVLISLFALWVNDYVLIEPVVASVVLTGIGIYLIKKIDQLNPIMKRTKRNENDN